MSLAWLWHAQEVKRNITDLHRKLDIGTSDKNMIRMGLIRHKDVHIRSWSIKSRFVKTGDELRSQDENNRQGKKN
jgi:hypothetical protein